MRPALGSRILPPHMFIADADLLIGSMVKQESQRKQVRLLVVDDHPEYCDLIRECSEIYNHTFELICTFTDSGEKALELIRTWEPSVILVDVHTAKADCFDLIDRCKRAAHPIIATSHEQSNEIERSVLAKGATAYMPKTDNLDEVELVLSEIASVVEVVDDAH